MTETVNGLLKIIVLTGLSCLVMSCKREDPTAYPPVKQPPLTSAAEQQPAPVLSGEDLPLLAAKPASEPDQAWEKLQETLQGPEYPAEWQIKEPTEQEFAEFRKKNAVFAGEAADKVKEFYTKYPNHEKASEAKKQEQQLLGIAVQLGNTNKMEQLRKLEQAQLDDPKADEEDRFGIRMQQVQRAVTQTPGAGPQAMLEELEKQVRTLQKEFPDRMESKAVLLEAAQRWLEHDLTRSRKLAEEVAKTEKLEPELKEAAEALLAKINRVGKPLEIKFTALDGREVDLQRMKGKVVLVDFWATWCGPCMAELPNVKATYDKLHSKGFEILGISFDQDKNALHKTLKQHDMPWPQFFDENNGGQKYGEEFGIEGIPTMWLVDKKGILRELNARQDLAGKVEKLLDEKVN